MQQLSSTLAICFFITSSYLILCHAFDASHPFLSDSHSDDLSSPDFPSVDSLTGESTGGGNSDPCNSHVCQHQYYTNPGQSASDDKRCPALLAYNQCMKTLSKSCRGNLEYHTVVTAVHKLMEQSNCSGSYHKSRQGMRSSFPVKSESERRQEEEDRRRATEQRRIDRCINEVLNYTFDHQNYIKNQELRRLRQLNRGHSRPLVKREGESHEDADESLILSPRSPSRGEKRLLSKHLTGDKSERNSKNNHEVSSPAATVNNDAPFQFDGNSLLSRELDDEEDEECEDDEDCDSANNDQPVDDQFANLKSLYERDEEPLLCSIFGGPHVRTFTDKYQTCLLQGARPMIDHPLFAIQVTSTRDASNREQIPGVTKVTLLVRQITICGIEKDLVYEVDTESSEASQDTDGESKVLPTAFQNGRSSTKNGLVRVYPRSDTEVCILLDHLAVQVCIRKFLSLKYLNVIVKFKKHMSTAQRSSMIDSMDSYTLCSSGCSYNEQVNVPKILSAVGFDVFNDSQYFNECQGLYGYYMIACLFDIKMKGTKSDQIDVHRFAQAMDDTLVVKRSFNTMKSEYLFSSSALLHSNKRPLILFAYLFGILYSLAWSAR